ncbi:unnamed protein product [Spirodela intermedia]|uniref:non-specific serine/threonine protein kinase n=1 Tax=Spirodela intermedia TaxID=51605 RepID=A0A7I8IQJ4_SPIIN|nr:unnamed protein product [Spirodela intermedia]CAA6660073.1 unnamed protein product [Spirodela intermedia]
MSTVLPAVLGGVAGAVALLMLLVILIHFWMLRRSVPRTAESSSSDPSPQGSRSVELPLTVGISYPSDLQGARCFSLEDLNKATKNFSENNLVGEGNFGEVYKGLILDMIVAVKRRSASPSQEFVQKVQKLSSIRHRNIVSLLGYCQESNLQMLIYEYIPNGSISSHLFGTSNTRLEFKHRLSIACRAAKGLAYLHSLNPPVVHMDFKTANVLVDENYIPKVADVGLQNFLRRNDGAGPSQTKAENLFLDPGVCESRSFTDKSDVYSFGVFLLELVSGTEASQLQFTGSNQGITEWAQDYDDSSDISVLIDRRMARSFTDKGLRDLLRLAVWCLNPSAGGRPPMSFVGSELDRILDKEMSLTTIMGEGTPTLTLGSELFMS